MPEPDWTAAATIEAAKLVRMNPSPPSRGVMKSDYPGVSLVFARSSEVPRLNQRLDNAGVETLGQGGSVGPFLDYTVAVIVRSEDLQRLLAIVRAASDP